MKKITVELTPAQLREVHWAVCNFTFGDDADCGTATRHNTLRKAEKALCDAVYKSKQKAGTP